MRPTSAGASPPATPAAAGSGTPTGSHTSGGLGPRWLIQVDGGEFQLVESERELAELARLGRVTGLTPVYTVVEGPRPLGEICDLVTFVPRPVSSEPPIRLERRSRERAMLSEELAILDRPLEDEVEYYDAVPVRRWPRRLALVLAVAAGVLGAYLLVLPRFPGWRSSVTARLALPARSWVASASPAGATPGPPAVLAVPAVTARVEGTPVIAAAADAPIPATPPAATGGAAPLANRDASPSEARKTDRPHRRHRSGNHASRR